MMEKMAKNMNLKMDKDKIFVKKRETRWYA
jgi:hypothetical protein